MLKNSWLYGIASGVFLIIIFYLSFRFGTNPFIDFKHLFVDAIIFSLFITFACLEFKRSQGGVLHFWQGMSIGFFVYAIASLVFMIFLGLYFNFEPELLDNYVSEALKFLEQRSDSYIEEFGEDQYESQVQTIQSITARDLTNTASIKKLIAGLFVTPVISIILRKQP